MLRDSSGKKTKYLRKEIETKDRFENIIIAKEVEQKWWMKFSKGL